MDKKVGPRARVLQFQEMQRPSIVRVGIDDLLTRGLVWMDETSGRVVQTELRAGSGTFPIRVVTLFGFDERIGTEVPTEMQGWYPGRDHDVTTRLKYRNFRQFQVQTTEAIR